MNPATLASIAGSELPTIVQPVHAAYDRVRAAWNLDVDQRPAAVAVATTARQVSEAVRFAAERGLKVAPQGTGHFAAALPSLEDVLLLRTALHDEADIDPVARTARVKAGALWRDVVQAAAPHGLLALHGSSHDVGVFGYTLGGGLSFLARRYGLAANHVTAAEVVTADGELRRVSADEEPDLFWAVRGGGGNFGVVTALEFALFDIRRLYAGTIYWPAEHARVVLRAWRDWTRSAPPAVTTSARILRLPPVPEIPEMLHEVPLVGIDGAVLGDVAAAEALVAPLRAAAPPMLDTWKEIPAPELLWMHGDPPEPVPAIGDHTLLVGLPDQAIDAFVEVAGADSGSALLAAELRQLGGALATPARGGGARRHLDGEFALFGVGVPVDEAVGAAVEADLERLLGAMSPWSNDRIYLNFGERGGSAEPAYSPEDYARLQRLRARWDPQELFVASHRIEAMS